mgnify:CR=1 FL=1
MSRAAVVIPLYQEHLSVSEKFSLRNTLSVLSAWDIYVVAPENLSTWLLKYREKKQYSFNISLFDNKWFHSIDEYNHLLMSRSFYRRFLNYEYMLIVQTDALVLADSLGYWCDCGYSYVGAPWFDGFSEPVEPNKLVGVGNGGFSLRRIGDFLRVLSRPRYISNMLPNVKNEAVPLLVKMKNLHRCLYIPYASFYICPKVQEDFFWGLEASGQCDFFSIPEPEVAAHFSFETCPEYLYEVTGHKLPFGCHAWEKYNWSFWHEVLGEQGISLPR